MMKLSVPILAKAVIMVVAVITLTDTEPFWHQLLLVIVSSTMTAVGVIIAAVVTARHVAKKVEEPIADIKEATKSNRRRTDKTRQGGE